MTNGITEQHNVAVSRSKNKPMVQAPAVTFRDVAWCGLWFAVPEAFRPFDVNGNTRRGVISLGAAGRPRLNIRWSTVAYRRVNAESLVRRQLLRGLPRRQARQLVPKIQTIENENIQPMLSLTDVARESTRCVGFSQVTNRLIELLYDHDTPREDALVRQIAFGQVSDQPVEGPQRWAFFDVSFIAPAAMRYENSKLNIGDMSVRLAGRPHRRDRKRGRRHRAAVTVRQIYPAELALQRKPINGWMDQLLDELKGEYRLPRARGRADQRYQPLETPRGDGLSCDLILRRGLRPFRWRIPRHQRIWLFNDSDHHRLTAIYAAGHPEEIDPTMSVVVDGLHWAKMEAKIRNAK